MFLHMRQSIANDDSNHQESTMFRVEDVPSVVGKVFVITGGNSGIGFEAARALVAKGGEVVLACRDANKMAAAATNLRTTIAGAKVHEVVLDLSSLQSIAAASTTLARLTPKVDVLINNAGVMALPERATVDGFEMQFGTNHLGHFAWTGLVLPLVMAAPKGRVVTVSSLLHRKGTIDFEAIPKPKIYDENKQYSMSKLANVLFSYELDRKLKRANSQALALACHPGYSSTNLQAVGAEMKGSRLLGVVMAMSNAIVAQPATMGMLGTLYAATGSDIVGAEYIGPTGLNHLRGYPKKIRSNDESYDVAVAEKLWSVSSQLTGINYPV
jgi:NAD(P)-dependent dehydrogenase (short-subunit alcohol dehydrogenase family)